MVLGQREGVPRKPNPAGMLEICRQLGLPAEVFLYLGDTATDMKTAVAAGCFPVGVLWGFRTEEELLDAALEMHSRLTSNYERTPEDIQSQNSIISMFRDYPDQIPFLQEGYPNLSFGSKFVRNNPEFWDLKDISNSNSFEK